jgi:N-acetylglucosaminyl-diphospho-decaprenol L-rhamnosyltransferase
VRMPSLDIILVNRNSGDLLRRCLDSIAAADRTAIELRRVCVVDDMSSDGSADDLRAADLPLVVLRQEQRRGYGASCNAGARGSMADYLLFLNTDIEVERNALVTPIAYLQRAEAANVGMLGIQLREPDGSVARSCSRFPTLGTFLAMMVGLDRLWPARFPNIQMREWDHGQTREVDQVMGAFLLMRRSLFEALGGYDERFFVYMEDIDLAMRARAAGLRSVYLADVRALHLGGGTARRAWSESLYFAARSRVQFAFKHLGTARGMVLAAGTLVVEPWTRAAHYLRAGSIADVAAALRAYARLWGWILRGAPLA